MKRRTLWFDGGTVSYRNSNIHNYRDALTLMHDLEFGRLEGYDPYHQFQDSNGRWVYVLFQGKGDR